MKLRFTIIFFILLTQVIFSQQWNSVLNVNPTPDPYVSKWEKSPGIAVFTVIYTGNSPQEVDFFIRISEKRSGEILTASSQLIYFPSGPATQTFTSLDFLDWNTIKYNSKIKSFISRSNKLPEGEYNICIQVKRLNTILTEACADFTISLPAPPQLLTPANTDSINTHLPVFQWTPVFSLDANISYKIKICELLYHQTVQKAITANLPIIETNILAGNVFQYPPEAFPLEKGKKYVWQIQALDTDSNEPISSNEGKSEIWIFTYPKDKPTNFKIVDDLEFEKKSNLVVNNFSLNMNVVNGTLLYQFAEEYVGFPLKSMNIKLVKCYKIGTKIYTDAFRDAGKVLATATSDDEGHFSFIYTDTSKMGLLQEDYEYHSGMDQMLQAEGDLFCVARVIVESPYYASPNKDVIIQPGETKNMGNFFSYVRSYSLKVIVLPDQQKKGQVTYSPLKFVKVDLCRYQRPLAVPHDEGIAPIPREKIGPLEIIGSGETNDEGVVIFKKLVKNITPNDYYIIRMQPDTAKGKYFYKSLQANYQFKYLNDNAEFSNEYQYQWLESKQYLNPYNPKVAGTVYRFDNQTQPIKDVTVRLWTLSMVSLSNYIEREVLTNTNGYFAFKNLPVEMNAQQDVIGPLRGMPMFKYGFRDTLLGVNNGAALNYGEQFIQSPIILQPFGKVTGRVISADESDIGVTSNVKVGDGSEVTTFTKIAPKQIGNLNMFVPTYGWFSSPAALGHHQPIYIQPFSGYFPKTIYKSVTKTEQDLGNLYVKKKLHRIKIIAKYAVPPNMSSAFAAPVENALVGIENLTGFTYTNSDGEASFTFESTGTDFIVKIKNAYPNYDIVPVNLPVQNDISENYITYNVYVKRGTKVSGHVYVGKENMPVSYAHVYLVEQTTGDKTEAWTDNNGSYTLTGVPMGTHQFAAVKGKSQYIGDTVSVSCVAGGVQNVDFHLRVYDGMDITSLMGIPIAVKSLDSTSLGVKISGEFFELPGDSIFTVINPNTTLAFNNIFIVPGNLKNDKGTPFALPKTLPVTLTESSLNLKMYKNYNVNVSNPAVYETNTGSQLGIIKGKVFLSASTSLQNISELELDGFYLFTNSSKPKGKTKILQDKLIIGTIAASGSNIHTSPEKFFISDEDGKSINYLYFDFSLKADSGKSYILNDTIRLSSVLSGTIENASPININLGDLVIHHNSIEPVTGKNPVEIKLSAKWTLNSAEWSLNQTHGFSLNSGDLKTGSVTVPFSNLNLVPSGNKKFKLVNGEFNIQALTLGGFLPITINPAVQKQFGFDNAKQCWILGVASQSGRTAFFTSLQGMDAQDTVIISNFRIVSEGSDEFNLYALSPPLKIYEVASFQPTGLTVANNLVQINGTMDLQMPGAGVKSSALNYSMKNGSITFGFDTFPFFISTNGVYVQFPGTLNTFPQEFSDFGFKAKGTIIDEEYPDMFKFNVWLYRTPDSTSIWIDENQNFVFTKNNTRMLKDVGGTMRVISNSLWDNFHFGGDLTGAAGAEGKLGFEVVGKMLPGVQEIQMKNVPTPFGDLAFTYDMSNGRLIGKLQFDKQLSGSARAYGLVTTVIDGSGWYFLGAGGYEMHNPFIAADCAVLFGDYPAIANTNEFKEVFLADPNRYSYNGMIPEYLKNQLSGFYFTGKAKLPIPLFPSVDINLDPVLHCYVDPFFGGYLSLGMNFGEYNSYFVHSAVFLGANAGLSGSVGLACAGASLHGEVVLYATGEYDITNGSWYAEGGADLILGGSAYVGVGCCNNDCDCLVEEFDVCVCGGCLEDHWADSITIEMIKLRLGEGGPKFCFSGLCN